MGSPRLQSVFPPVSPHPTGLQRACHSSSGFLLVLWSHFANFSGRFFFINQFPNLGLSSWLYFISSHSFPSDFTQTVGFSVFPILLTSQIIAQCQSFLLNSVITSHLLDISFCTFCRHLIRQVWVAFLHILVWFGSIFLMSVKWQSCSYTDLEYRRLFSLMSHILSASKRCHLEFWLNASIFAKIR